MAVSGRRDQEASFFTVVVWRDQAEHAAESLSKGSRVVVVGDSSDDDQDDEEPGAGEYRVGQDVLTSVTLDRGSSGSRIWSSTAWRRARGLAFYVDS